MSFLIRFPVEKTRQPGETPQGHKARRTLEQALKLRQWDPPLLDELAIGQMGFIDLANHIDDPVVARAIAELDDVLEKLEQLDQED